MNILNKILVLALILGSFAFSRSGATNTRSSENLNQSKKRYYSFKEFHGESSHEIDRRKRSHKRRRKIKRPSKGLR